MTEKKIQVRVFVTILLVISINLVSYAQDAMTPAIVNYIKNYAQLAIKEMNRTGVPASIKIAQGILETDAGRSDLVLRSNNHFGIKCKSSWTGDKVYHDDDAQGECFRKYNSADDSYLDHSDYLKSQPRYSFLFSYDKNDYTSWAWGLKKAGYATNPIYAQTIIKYVERYNLNALNQISSTFEDSALNNYFGSIESNLGIEGSLTVSKKNEVLDEKINGQPLQNNITSPTYPEGIFRLNGLKVIYAKEGTSLLSIAQKQKLQMASLLSWNELPSGTTILNEDQLIYLQKKKKTGANNFHIIKRNESLKEISQTEGIQLHSLLSLNKLNHGMTPKVGEKISLKKPIKERPDLVDRKGQKKSGSRYAIHKVKQGESLYTIAKKYNVSVDSIKQANSMKQEGLQIGQTLKILK